MKILTVSWISNANDTVTNAAHGARTAAADYVLCYLCTAMIFCRLASFAPLRVDKLVAMRDRTAVFRRLYTLINGGRRRFPRDAKL